MTGITWQEFPAFALLSVLLWLAGASLSFFDGRRRAALVCTALGLLVYLAFIAGLWISLGRPPMRTIGETRLFYSFFMVVSGWAVFIVWRYRWIQLYSAIVAAVFIALNILKPELHDQSLMPALQSFWFVPHVAVYMFSYSVFGCACLLSVAGLFGKTPRYLEPADTLVRIGLCFLTFGMLSGAIWAKQAWGGYWTWDPKETWAAATWLVYLAYMHLRLSRGGGGMRNIRLQYAMLIAGFVVLQMCWYGADMLPWATQTLHSYLE